MFDSWSGAVIRRLACWPLLALLVTSPLRAQSDVEKLVTAARDRTETTVTYDGSYRRLAYPNGDVPDHIGVCTDLVIRTFRSAWGRDLQRQVHEDMQAEFEAYPGHWGLSRPDANIDHRRVPNLETYFARHELELSATNAAADYHAGDIVTWRLNHRLPHIGIVSDQIGESGRPLIIHNVGAGPQEEDVLFAYPLHRHFRIGAATGLVRE